LSEVQVYTGVIAILIESAVPLAVFGVISAILQQLNPSGSFLRRSEAFYVCVFVFRALFISFCVSLAIEAVRNSIWLTSLKGLSPHMIIFRVTTGRSLTNFRALNDSLISNPIQFARRSFESSSIQSTWSRELGQDSAIPDTERGLN
jgi:hypothetical protein